MHSEARVALLAWFDEHKRDLPWRRTRDPYAIWVSEIMLQQTRVAAVLEHYARWMERFPTVAALAAADEPEVLALWSGLGYYRRPRMLHKAARVVMEWHGGEVPGSAAELRKLPGVGAYTAAAVASIAFGEPIAVVDGNVERVALRLAGDGIARPSAAGQELVTPASTARAVRALAQTLVDPERAGDSNQAMMELGATVCLPKAPLCLQCPLERWCATRGEHATTARAALVRKAVSYGLATRQLPAMEAGGAARGPEVWLRQRQSDAALMPGMWELPEAAGGAREEPILELRHAITVTNYQVRIVPLEMDPQRGVVGCAEGAWVAVDGLPEIALTGLTRKVLRRIGLWPGGR